MQVVDILLVLQCLFDRRFYGRAIVSQGPFLFLIYPVTVKFPEVAIAEKVPVIDAVDADGVNPVPE